VSRRFAPLFLFPFPPPSGHVGRPQTLAQGSPPLPNTLTFFFSCSCTGLIPRKQSLNFLPCATTATQRLRRFPFFPSRGSSFFSRRNMIDVTDPPLLPPFFFWCPPHASERLSQLSPSPPSRAESGLRRERGKEAHFLFLPPFPFFSPFPLIPGAGHRCPFFFFFFSRPLPPSLLRATIQPKTRGTEPFSLFPLFFSLFLVVFGCSSSPAAWRGARSLFFPGPLWYQELRM